MKTTDLITLKGELQIDAEKLTIKLLLKYVLYGKLFMLLCSKSTIFYLTLVINVIIALVVYFFQGNKIIFLFFVPIHFGFYIFNIKYVFADLFNDFKEVALLVEVCQEELRSRATA